MCSKVYWVLINFQKCRFLFCWCILIYRESLLLWSYLKMQRPAGQIPFLHCHTHVSRALPVHHQRGRRHVGYKSWFMRLMSGADVKLPRMLFKQQEAERTVIYSEFINFNLLKPGNFPVSPHTASPFTLKSASIKADMLRWGWFMTARCGRYTRPWHSPLHQRPPKDSRQTNLKQPI